MSKTKFICCISILFFFGTANAQRHYTVVSALEANHGLNVFAKPNTNLNFAYSMYKNRTTYCTLGLNNLEHTQIYKS